MKSCYWFSIMVIMGKQYGATPGHTPFSHVPLHYTLSVQNIKNIFLMLSCTPSFCPQFIGAWTLHGVESIPHGCWTMLTPMLPTVVKLAGCPVEHEKPSSVAVLDTNRWAWQLLQYPVQRHLNLLSCPFTLWMAHINNPCLKAYKIFFNLFPPHHLHWLKWI